MRRFTFDTASTLTRDPNTLILSVSMGVFPMRIFAFSIFLGCLTPGFLLSKNPSSRKESSRVPPLTLVIWMASKLPDDFNLKTASTAILLKKSLWVVKILELKVVLKLQNWSSFYSTATFLTVELMHYNETTLPLKVTSIIIMAKTDKIACKDHRSFSFKYKLKYMNCSIYIWSF